MWDHPVVLAVCLGVLAAAAGAWLARAAFARLRRRRVRCRALVGGSTLTMEVINAESAARTVEICGITGRYLYGNRSKQQEHALPADADLVAELQPGAHRSWTFLLVGSMVDLHRLRMTDELWVRIRVGAREDSIRAQLHPEATTSIPG